MYTVSNPSYGGKDCLVCFFTLPDYLYRKDYYYNVIDLKNYFLFQLKYKNILIEEFKFFYNSNDYYFYVDNFLNISFYKYKKRLPLSYDHFLIRSIHCDYIRPDGSTYSKNLKFSCLSDSNKIGLVNSYNHKCYQCYVQFQFNL